MTSNLLTGTKSDIGKPRWDLMPVSPEEEVVRVLTYGSLKYDDWNWQKVILSEKGLDRYYSAAMRHIVAWRKGQLLDSGSHLYHMAHAICCLLFVLWKDQQVNNIPEQLIRVANKLRQIKELKVLPKRIPNYAKTKRRSHTRSIKVTSRFPISTSRKLPPTK